MAGVDFSVGDYDQRTALHVATAEGHVQVVHFLKIILTKEQANARDRWGQNAADCVAEPDTKIGKRLLKTLKKAGVHPNSNSDEKTRTLLQHQHLDHALATRREWTGASSYAVKDSPHDLNNSSPQNCK